MELKEAVEIIKQASIAYSSTEIGQKYEEALQIAISHLETLQRVKEAGGVKRQEQKGDGDESLDGQNSFRWVNGFNEALDAVHAELAGKLKGLEGVFAKIKVCKPNQEDCSFRKCHDFSGCKILKKSIQELFLGKKEE